jgi:uracil-DNA glycosylase family 4
VQGRPSKAVRAFGAKGGFCIVAEAPGTDELYQGFPLVGSTGKLLNGVLRRGGIDRNLAFVTNALLCKRPVADEAFAKAVDCCRPRLEEELRFVEPTGIVALGAVAARALRLPVSTISEARGTVQESPLVPGVPVVTALHPAALFKGGAGEVSGGKQKMNVDAQMMFLQADVEKAWAISEGKRSPCWSDDGTVVTKPEEAEAAMRAVLDEARAWGMLGIDLEWTKEGRITWLGLGHGGKWSGGAEGRSVAFWKDAIPEAVLKLAADAIADETLPKLIHNLQADKEVWEREIGPMRGPIRDTLLMHHAAFPGLAHDLQQMASQFLVVPPWKTQRRDERKANEKAARARAKEEIKMQKKAEHEARNAAKKVEAEARKAAAKSEKQRAHDEENLRRAEEAAAKKAARQAAHDAENARRAAEAEARRAGKKSGAGAAKVDPPSLPLPLPEPAAPAAPPSAAPRPAPRSIADAVAAAGLVSVPASAPAPAARSSPPSVASTPTAQAPAQAPKEKKLKTIVVDENGVEKEIG